MSNYRNYFIFHRISVPLYYEKQRIFADDRRVLTGQFILTGSVAPKDDVFSHSGTGRISRFRMRPMSLFESGESSGEVLLGSLFDGNTDVAEKSNLSIKEIANALCRGGWPMAVKMKKQSSKVAYNYVDSVILG